MNGDRGACSIKIQVIEKDGGVGLNVGLGRIDQVKVILKIRLEKVAIFPKVLH
jgi:hypothetical protein